MEEMDELSEPSGISVVELSCTGRSSRDQRAHAWQRAACSHRCVQAIARCRVLSAQRKAAELALWRQGLDSEERIVLEKLYALGALTSCDPIARQQRFVKVTHAAGKAVEVKAPLKAGTATEGNKSNAKPKRGVADAVKSLCRPKGKTDQSKPPGAPIRRINSYEIAALLGMREEQRHGGTAPMVPAAARRADRTKGRP